MFNNNSSLEDLFNLPEGRYVANMGFFVEQSVSPDYVGQAGSALLASEKEFQVFSQAGAIVKAQELGVAFDSWLPLKVI